MTTDPATAALAAGDRAPRLELGNLPGFRTLRSSRFRIVVAATLLAVAGVILGLTLARQAGDPNGQFGIDFNDYRTASQQMAAGTSPYAPDMLAGPIDAQGTNRYRYPPVFAQLLIPLASLPAGAAALLWLLVQAAAVYAAVWITSGAGGARPSVERALWCGVAATCFLPVFDTLWKGNVSAIVALQVALITGGAALGGVSLASAALLKVSPIALAPIALARDRRFLVASVATTAAVVGVSFILAPSAWLDYARVLPNLFAGDATQSTNLSPWAMSLTLGASTALANMLRAASVIAAVGCALVAIPVARRRGGWRAAVVLGTISMLLLPAQLWYHYLAVLLPLAALAWGRATAGQRLCLFISAAAVSLGIAWLPLATLGATALAATLLVTFWPARSLQTTAATTAAAQPA